MLNTQYDNKLAVIITDTAERVRDSITVEVNRGLPTVSISDESGVQESLLIAGDSACEFLDEAQRYYDQAGAVSMEDALLCVAAPYAETLWN